MKTRQNGNRYPRGYLQKADFLRFQMIEATSCMTYIGTCCLEFDALFCESGCNSIDV